MPWIDSHLQLLTSLPHTTLSRTLKVRGGIISQANRYLGGFCSSQRIFPPQIIQVLLLVHNREHLDFDQTIRMGQAPDFNRRTGRERPEILHPHVDVAEELVDIRDIGRRLDDVV